MNMQKTNKQKGTNHFSTSMNGITAQQAHFPNWQPQSQSSNFKILSHPYFSPLQLLETAISHPQLIFHPRNTLLLHIAPRLTFLKPRLIIVF